MQVLPMTRRIFILATIAFMAVASAAAWAGDTYVSFVQKMGDTALTELTGKSLSMSEREKRVRDLFAKNFDVKTIGQFVMGRHWRSATEKERAEFLRLFEDMIVKTYAQRFEEYEGQQFKAERSEKVGSKDYMVSSQVLQKSGPPVKVEWRVRPTNGNPKVIDVLIENVSMSVTQRSDFDAVIQRGGNKVEALLDSLRKRQQSAKK